MAELGFSAQMTGGIFGWHGTGAGALFSIIQACLCVHIYYYTRKIIYLFLAIFIAVPMITGFVYAGIGFLIISLLLILFKYFQTSNFRQIMIPLFAVIVILFGLYKIESNRLTTNDYIGTHNKADDSAFKIYSNWNGLITTLIFTSEVVQAGRGLGRIGAVIFGYNEMIKDFKSFIIGHGPGSISYSGYTMGYINPMQHLRTVGLILVALMYDLGIWGPFFLMITFFMLYKKWKKTIRPDYGLSQYYYDNMNVVLMIFFFSTIYTSLLNNYFMLFFFAIQISYLNYLGKNDPSNFNTQR